MAGSNGGRRGGLLRAATMIARGPVAGLLSVPPKTVGYGVGAWLRARTNGSTPHVSPVRRPTWTLAGNVALDEALLGIMKNPARFPSEADCVRVAAELRDMRRLHDVRGWTDAPLTYHRTPPAIPEPARRRSWSNGVLFERLSWPSGYAPHPEEPGAERWASYTRNHTAHAWMIRGSSPERPWLIGLHGYAMGFPTGDLHALQARRLAATFDLNLLFPVLPLHGPRRASRMSGAEMMSAELATFPLGMAQAMWDVRGVIAWARAQGASRVGVHGISLGAYTAALLALLEPDLDLLIAGVPLIDTIDLYVHHAPAAVRTFAESTGLLGDEAREALRVVAPTCEPMLIPRERVHIYAGVVDRMSTPAQAERLWEHWARPGITWYEGGHLGFLWSDAVRAAFDDALRDAGFAD